MNNKKIYIYPFIARISVMFFLLGGLFVLFLEILNDDFLLKDLLLLIFIFLFTVFLSLYIHLNKIYINTKKDRIYFILGFSKDEKYERILSDIKEINVKKDNNNLLFSIIYNNNYIENRKFSLHRKAIISNSYIKKINKKLNKWFE